MQEPIAEAAALLGDRAHALAKAGIVCPGRLISHGHATAADGLTRPPFAHPEGVSEMGDSFPLGRGRLCPASIGLARPRSRIPIGLA